jgi:cytochrome c oxidase assembly protein Cox11
MEQTIIEKLSYKFNKDPDEVTGFIGEFMQLMHKEFYESNEDVVGAPMYYNLGPKGYYHFLGMIKCFSEKYDEVYPEEYLLRLGITSDWKQYSDQIAEWKKSIG